MINEFLRLRKGDNYHCSDENVSVVATTIEKTNKEVQILKYSMNIRVSKENFCGMKNIKVQNAIVELFRDQNTKNAFKFLKHVKELGNEVSVVVTPIYSTEELKNFTYDDIQSSFICVIDKLEDLEDISMNKLKKLSFYTYAEYIMYDCFCKDDSVKFVNGWCESMDGKLEELFLRGDVFEEINGVKRTSKFNGVMHYLSLIQAKIKPSKKKNIDFDGVLFSDDFSKVNILELKSPSSEWHPYIEDEKQYRLMCHLKETYGWNAYVLSVRSDVTLNTGEVDRDFPCYFIKIDKINESTLQELKECNQRGGDFLDCIYFYNEISLSKLERCVDVCNLPSVDDFFT